MTVLFVCSGNICRSPMAAALLRERVAASASSAILVESAGTLGIEGYPASAEAAQALAEIGVDLRQHRSRGLDRALLDRADVVIVMTRDHLRELAALDPRAAAKTFLLREFEKGASPDPHAPDLDDPIGEGVGLYREQREIVQRAVEHLFEYVEERT